MMALRRCRVAFLAALVLLASSSVRSQENELFHCPDGKSLMISVAISFVAGFFSFVFTYSLRPMVDIFTIE
jgi:hypothetical protein